MCVRVTRLSTIRSERIMARKRLFAARYSSVTPSISQGARRRMGGICFRARPVIPTLMRRVARLTSPLHQQLDVKIVARVSVEPSVNSRSHDWLRDDRNKRGFPSSLSPLTANTPRVYKHCHFTNGNSPEDLSLRQTDLSVNPHFSARAQRRVSRLAAPQGLRKRRKGEKIRLANAVPPFTFVNRRVLSTHRFRRRGLHPVQRT